MLCSLTEKLCCCWCRLRHRAQINLRRKRQGEKPPCSRTGTSSLLAPNVAVTRKCCSRQLNVDIRKNLHANVVLSGGTTILQGICEHMMLHSRCISRLLLHERESTRFGVFSQFLAQWTSQGEYDESGPRVSTVGSVSSLNFSLFFLHVLILTLNLVYCNFL